jgi:hypothetical protein
MLDIQYKISNYSCTFEIGFTTKFENIGKSYIVFID